jgi:glucoamylase
MTDHKRAAPGGPGHEPRWTASAKSGVGTAFDGRSLVWFTLAHGIVNEVYYPRVDRANTRDFGLIVSAGDGFFSEEARDTRSVLHLVAPEVPGYRLVNTCKRGRYEIEKTIITDSERPVLVQRIRFRALVGSLQDYRVFALLAPHIGNQGYDNDAWLGDYKGTPMLFAQRGETALALACHVPWRATSCGFVGVNDGWTQVKAAGALTHVHDEARRGNVALTGEIDLAASALPSSSDDGGQPLAEFVLTLGFGLGPAAAAQQTRMTMASTFERIEASYVRGWREFHRETTDKLAAPTHSLTPEITRREAARDLASHADDSTLARATHAEPVAERRRRVSITLPESVLDLYRMSAAILAVHEDKRASGALIASLSIPWGHVKSDHELGGYHLVWPRDLVQSAGALLAVGHTIHARRTLRYLVSTQESDGHWSQNTWLDGTPYWTGIQLDETAFPILLAELLYRAGELKDIEPWPCIRRAADFLVHHGPVTGQDRWEENSGYSPYTIAVCVAALHVAADFAQRAGELGYATGLRATADHWNDVVDRCTYVTGTELAERCGVDGYYVRIAPVNPAQNRVIPVRNRPDGFNTAPFDRIVSPDALGLVRYGLRHPDDPRILNTIKVIDSVLRVRTATGPGWYRYNEDGYGEKADASPFDGVGVGRPWPLLAGERGHYELAAGRPEVALQLLGVMRAQASDGGMLPEQIWDRDDVPANELFNGRASGGAMPLSWAHAEYAKLVRSLRDGRVFDMPRPAYERYVLSRRDPATPPFPDGAGMSVSSLGEASPASPPSRI